MGVAHLITGVVTADVDEEMTTMVPVALGGTNEAAAGLTTTTDRILDQIQVRLHRPEVQVLESVCPLPLPRQTTTITTNPTVTRLEFKAITKVGISPRPNTLHEEDIKGTMAVTSTTTATGVAADTEARGRGNNL